MIAYEAGQWHDLFTVAGEAAAGLGGLLFVAVSLNQRTSSVSRGCLRWPRGP